MSTIHEEGARNALRTWMRHPETAGALMDVEARLQTDEFDPWLVDVVGQVYLRHPSQWAMEHVLMLAMIHMDIVQGKIGLVDIGLWHEPRGDGLRAENQAAINELPDPFWGEVDDRQYGADSDGFLEWSAPIRVSVATGQTVENASGRPKPVMKNVILGPRRLPLEVGSSMPSRTILHIREGFGVARWPYGHKKVGLLLNMEHLLPDAVWSRDVTTEGCSCHAKLALPSPESLRDEPLPHDE